MTNPCSPGTSEPKDGFAPTIIFDAVKIGNFFSGQLMGWLSPFALQIGTQTFDLTTFCSTDPPTEPTQDLTTIAGFFSPTNPTGAADLHSWILDEFNYLVWYACCQCTSGSSITPPTPTPQPDIQTNPPSLTNPTTATACHTFIDTEDVFLGSGASQDTLPDVLTWPEHGYTGANITVTNGIRISPGVSLAVHVKYVNSVGTVLGNAVLGTLTPGQTNSWFVSLSTFSGTEYLQMDFTGTGGGLGGATVTPIEWDIYCNGNTPTTTSSPCCPPDASITAALSYIEQLLEGIYAALPTPVASFAESTAHTGLSGAGNVSLGASVIAVRVDLTTVPDTLGGLVGSPPIYFDAGFITPVSTEGPYSPERVNYATQVYNLPILVGEVDYSFAAGVIATITELTAGP